MEKNDVRVIVGIVLLLILAIINNSHWFVPNRLSETVQYEDELKKQENDAVEIMERAEIGQNVFTVPEGKYYFNTVSGGVYDIISNDNNMEIDGKILNKKCCLENYMPMEDGTIEIRGKGTVSFRTIDGKSLQLEKQNGKRVIQNSGYYSRDSIIGSSSGEVTLVCEPGDMERQMPKIQIMETYTRKIIEEFQWKTGTEKYVCKLEKGKSLFVDLGNETEEKRNVLHILD